MSFHLQKASSHLPSLSAAWACHTCILQSVLWYILLPCCKTKAQKYIFFYTLNSLILGKFSSNRRVIVRQVLVQATRWVSESWTNNQETVRVLGPTPHTLGYIATSVTSITGSFNSQRNLRNCIPVYTEPKTGPTKHVSEAIFVIRPNWQFAKNALVRNSHWVNSPKGIHLWSLLLVLPWGLRWLGRKKSHWGTKTYHGHGEKTRKMLYNKVPSLLRAKHLCQTTRDLSKEKGHSS